MDFFFENTDFLGQEWRINALRTILKILLLAVLLPFQ